MGKKKKQQFISKKNAHKFTLVHRSQKDPLQADDEAGQHVLLPMEDNNISNEENRKEQNIKHGIYFDDDYDYMQHLQPRGEGILVLADGIMDEKSEEKVSMGNLKLPSEVFASNGEEAVGMLNKGVLPRGPQPDWDPDIVAALDDGIDFDNPENLLEDDFMSHANTMGEEGNYFDEENARDNENYEWVTDSEYKSDISSDNLFSDDDIDEFEKEETKSRFTNYSMTSSIIRRTEGLKVLDDCFERIMEEYDEEEIGCINHKEVHGALQSDCKHLNNIVANFIDSVKTHSLEATKGEEEETEIVGVEDSSDSEDEEKIFSQFKTEPKDEWDCESILSTYSNIYNHPKLIDESSKPKTFELHKRTGLPLGVLEGKKKDDFFIDNSKNEPVLVSNLRSKHETAEEKKLRKQNVKGQRKSRRMEKKSNRMAFKNEFLKQERVSTDQKGIKL